MVFDSEGKLLPFMLSDLIKIAQQALTEHGDMPTGVYTCYPGYEHNEEHSFPVSDPPSVTNPNWLRSYFGGKFKKSFVLEGE